MGQYDYGARFYDPVVGRWTSADPLVEVGQESTTPYGYVFNNPMRFTDPDGKVPESADGCCGVRQAVATIVNIATAIPRAILPQSIQASAVKAIDKTANGAGFPTLNQTVDVLNGTASADDQSAFTGRTLAGIQGILMSGEMGEVPVIESPRIQIDITNKIDRELLNPPSRPGNAPTFKHDGSSVEIHHVGEQAEGPFKEVHKADHRFGENYKKNHPNEKPLTKAERKQFDKDKREYWKNEYQEYWKNQQSQN